MLGKREHSGVGTHVDHKSMNAILSETSRHVWTPNNFCVGCAYFKSILSVRIEPLHISTTDRSISNSIMIMAYQNCIPTEFGPKQRRHQPSFWL